MHNSYIQINNRKWGTVQEYLQVVKVIRMLLVHP